MTAGGDNAEADDGRLFLLLSPEASEEETTIEGSSNDKPPMFVFAVSTEEET